MDQTVRVLGVPMDLGADRRGVDMGPSAIRYAGLADRLESIGQPCVDGGDIAVMRPEERDPDAASADLGHAKYVSETREVCEDVATAVSATVSDGEFPLVLGGDHSIAVGTAAGVADDRNTGLVWFDAHGDFNTPETTPSGNVHGMALAAILGVGPFADLAWAHTPRVRPENVALVGLRDVDDGERTLLGESRVSTYTMTDIDERGITDVVEEAIDVATRDVEQLHVSFDMDCLDPTEAPGVGTPVRGGISYREAHAAMERISSTAGTRLCSFEVVEVNPILDQHNRTAELATELVASALGQRIL
ncbi:arginase [Salinibaculum rarum]|uniref:arginase n=1 Tax=Salinibaculum rarum TaxID=3058903 RepID=UPI00265E383A|nr:arginase [Salinibaculum sp. KK48]